MVSPIVIGKSVDGWPIEGFRIGQGQKKIAFLAGLHGNEPKATQLIKLLYEHCSKRLESFPSGISLLFLPIANPDGWRRFQRCNARNVDLNRNWGYNWQPTNYWGGCGRRPFSEPETKALRKFLRNYNVVIDYHTCNRYTNSGGYVLSGRGEQGNSVGIAKSLASALQYEYHRCGGDDLSGLMIDYLDKKRVKSCVVELFDAQGGEPLEQLSELHYKAIRNLIRRYLS